MENRGRYILGLESRADREEQRFHILNRIRGEERKVSGLGRGEFSTAVMTLRLRFKAASRLVVTQHGQTTLVQNAPHATRAKDREVMRIARSEEGTGERRRGAKLPL